MEITSVCKKGSRRNVWIGGSILRELMILVNGHSTGRKSLKMQKTTNRINGYMEKYFRNDIRLRKTGISAANKLTQKMEISKVKIVNSILIFLILSQKRM